MKAITKIKMFLMALFTHKVIYTIPTKKIIISKERIIPIINRLEALAQIRDRAFAEFILFNGGVLIDFVEETNRKIKGLYPPEWKEYQAELENLNNKYKDISKDGKSYAIFVDGKKTVIKKYKADLEYKEVDVKYAETVALGEKAKQDGIEMTKGDVELGLFVFPRAALPQQISAQDIRVLDVLIEPLKKE